MSLSRGLLTIACMSTLVLGNVHHFYSGFFSGDSLYNIQFDESTSELSVVYNGTLDIESSKWIATDKKRKNLYVADESNYHSYGINSNKSLVYKGGVSIADNSCNNANYLISSTAEPFTVFGAPYSSGCPGQAIAVTSSGALKSIVANISYGSTSGVHGLALSSDNRFIYSGDDMGGSVWAHSYDATSNKVSKVQQLNVTGNPRHLVVSPQGSYVYVMLETGNEVGVFTRESKTGRIAATNTTFSTIPSGYTNTSLYWSDEVMFSVPQEGEYPKYLFATARSRTAIVPGFVTAFSLDSVTGAIKDQLFITPTTGSGGASNAISPAIFSEQYFAIADAESNFVEVWKLGNEEKGASVVAHLDTEDSPANLVWVD